VFEPDPAGSVVFRAATGLDANAIAQVQARVRRRLLRSFVRRGLTGNDARAMAQWEPGGRFSVDVSVRIDTADRQDDKGAPDSGSAIPEIRQHLIVLQQATAGCQDPRQVLDSRQIVRSVDVTD
jgi:hypothetical protein